MTAAPPPSSGPSPPLVELRGATLGYPERAVLRDVDLEVRRGDFLAIVGPNGAGKTTALRTILGVLAPLRGTCVARGRLGYAPQRSALDPIFPFTAAEVVAMGLLGQPGVDPGGPAAAARVDAALAACGMAAQRDAAFRDLSGGQKQRVLVARALVAEPDVLVLDEPTNDLDLRGEHEVMELVRALHAGGRTVVMVSHLLHVVSRYARRIAFIRDGTLVAGDVDGMLTPARLEPLYGLPVVVGELAGHRVVAPGPPPQGAPPPPGAPSPPPGAPSPGPSPAPPNGAPAPAPPASRKEAARARREAARAALEESRRLERAAAAPPGAAALAPVTASAPPSRGEASPWPWAAAALAALTLLAVASLHGERRARREADGRAEGEARARADEARRASERELDLASRLALLQVDAEALTRGQEQLQARLAAGRRELAEAAAARDTAARERDAQVARAAAADAELAAVTSRLAVAARERAAVAAELADAGARSAALSVAKDDAERAAADARDRAAALERQRERLERASEDAARREAALARERDAAGVARGAAEAARDAAQAALAGAQAALEALAPVALRVAARGEDDPAGPVLVVEAAALAPLAEGYAVGVVVAAPAAVRLLGPDGRALEGAPALGSPAAAGAAGPRVAWVPAAAVADRVARGAPLRLQVAPGVAAHVVAVRAPAAAAGGAGP